MTNANDLLHILTTDSESAELGGVSARLLEDNELSQISGGGYASNGAGAHLMGALGNFNQTGGVFSQQGQTSYRQWNGSSSASLADEVSPEG